MDDCQLLSDDIQFRIKLRKSGNIVHQIAVEISPAFCRRTIGRNKAASRNENIQMAQQTLHERSKYFPIDCTSVFLFD